MLDFDIYIYLSCGCGFDYDLMIIGDSVGGHGAALHAIEKGQLLFFCKRGQLQL